ncbi:hypothetical protein DSO57_1002645 [Entomophthora muscae]|uniref:Uncharacterized protein n=1 Tax=Entomophthora muscae TaxID=34485 RepID=A0ACC2TJF7_9FUNG|nr:hypothetical protein DSO57_1002645 [Entomophthora muscae]
MLVSLFLGFGLFLSGLLAKQCILDEVTNSLPLCLDENMYERKNIYDTTSDERQAFFDGFQAVAQGPELQQIVELVENKDISHDDMDVFWLRALLHLFEKAMQAKVTNAKLPYWDSVRDYPWTDSNRVDSSSLLGGFSKGTCWILTRFPKYKAMSTQEWDKTCIERNFKDINSFLVDKTIVKLYMEYETFTEIHAKLVELWPKKVNGKWVPLNPKDPLFYVHMAFVDKLFTDWQNMKPINKKLARNPPDTLIQHFNVPIKQVINLNTRLCYSYKEAGKNTYYTN